MWQSQNLKIRCLTSKLVLLKARPPIATMHLEDRKAALAKWPGLFSGAVLLAPSLILLPHFMDQIYECKGVT